MFLTKLGNLRNLKKEATKWPLTAESMILEMFIRSVITTRKGTETLFRPDAQTKLFLT